MFSGTVFSAGNAVVSIIAYPVYLNYLGAEKYGLWTLISVVFAYSQLGQMGIERALMKYVASDYGKKDFKGITEYISTSFYILFVPSLCVIIFLALFKSQIADIMRLDKIFRSDGVPLIFAVGVLSVFSFFVNAVKGVVAGVGRMDIAHYHTLLGRVLQIILNVCLLIAGMGIWSLYYGFLIFYIVPLLWWVYTLKKTYRIRIFNPMAFNRQKMNELMRFGGTLVAGMAAQMLVTPFNKIIIGRYIGLAEVAYYQIALQVVMTVRNLFARGLEAIMPKVSEIYDKSAESISEVLSVHKKAIRFVFLFVAPLLLFIFISSDVLLKLWLGEEFNVQIATALKILLVGWFVHSFAVPDYFMFLGIGKVGYSVGATCLRSAANVLLIFALVFMNLNITFNKVIIIDSASLAAEVIFLKYMFFDFKRLNMTAQT